MKAICIDANVFIASTKGDEAYSSNIREPFTERMQWIPLILKLR